MEAWAPLAIAGAAFAGFLLYQRANRERPVRGDSGWGDYAPQCLDCGQAIKGGTHCRACRDNNKQLRAQVNTSRVLDGRGGRLKRADHQFGQVKTKFGALPHLSDLDSRIYERDLAEAAYRQEPTEANRKKFELAHEAYSNPLSTMGRTARGDSKAKRGKR